MVLRRSFSRSRFLTTCAAQVLLLTTCVEGIREAARVRLAFFGEGESRTVPPNTLPPPTAQATPGGPGLVTRRDAKSSGVDDVLAPATAKQVIRLDAAAISKCTSVINEAVTKEDLKFNDDDTKEYVLLFSLVLFISLVLDDIEQECLVRPVVLRAVRCGH